MSQRKGLADLFEAMKLLKGEPISLSILGQPSMPMEFYRKIWLTLIITRRPQTQSSRNHAKA